MSRKDPEATFGLGTEYRVAIRKDCMRSLCQYSILQSPSPYQGRFTNSVYKIDYLTVLLAIHRLNGLATPANTAYSVTELAHQLKSSGAVALFTCVSLLETALKAAQAAGISHNAIFVIDVPGYKSDIPFKTVESMIAEGVNLPDIESLQWTEGQGARQPAFLCYSSGTSGVPVSISSENKDCWLDRDAHRNTESCHDFASECHLQRHAVQSA
jgi:acyl-CoA synthetase (AMP-forming)/AMP-acid ligase II